MNKRLIWNFNLSIEDNDLNEVLNCSNVEIEKNQKWESRYFWDDKEDICLYGLNESFLSFSKYKFKTHQDTYIFSPTSDKNIKIRHNKLTYKPLLQVDDNTFCYAKKQKFDLTKQNPSLISLFPEISAWDTNTDIISNLAKHYVLLPIYKEAFTYKVSEKSKINFEFSRLQLFDKFYFSLCLESRNKLLVQNLSKIIAPDYETKHYIQFLKSLKI